MTAATLTPVELEALRQLPKDQREHVARALYGTEPAELERLLAGGAPGPRTREEKEADFRRLYFKGASADELADELGGLTPEERERVARMTPPELARWWHRRQQQEGEPPEQQRWPYAGPKGAVTAGTASTATLHLHTGSSGLNGRIDLFKPKWRQDVQARIIGALCALMQFHPRRHVWLANIEGKRGKR